MITKFFNTISHDSQLLSAGFDTLRTNARKIFYYYSNHFLSTLVFSIYLNMFVRTIKMYEQIKCKSIQLLVS